jgi:D-alanine-D-alanine ligase
MGFNAVGLDMQKDYYERIKEISPDVVLIMLHGKPGEDGTIQGALELMGIPYTGSRVLASAIGINKITTKRLLIEQGLPTPDYYYDPFENDPEILAKNAIEKLGLPLVVKPVDEGSSLGVHIVREIETLKTVVEEDLREFENIYFEKFIVGKSVTVGVLGTGKDSFALPILELRPKGREFYDYEAKYTKGLTEFIIPAQIPEETYKKLQKDSVLTHQLIGCRGFSRVDAVVSNDGTGYILEINTIPGMTDLSDLPAEAAHMGIDYDTLVLYILSSAFE